jgi:rRNA maturation protein Nop10
VLFNKFEAWTYEGEYRLLLRYTLFKCPLCGADGYVPVRVKKPNGDWYHSQGRELRT